MQVVAGDGGFDLRLGPATLQSLDGQPWSAKALDMSGGIAGSAEFEGRRFDVEPRGFATLELPGEPWFGVEVELHELASGNGPWLSSTLKLTLGLTRDERLGTALREAEWLPGRRASVASAGQFDDAAQWVVHQIELPKGHRAIPVAPQLYGVFNDPIAGRLRFESKPEPYEAQLQNGSPQRSR